MVTHLDDMGQAGVLDARGTARCLAPLGDGGVVHVLAPRQCQHEFLAHARVIDQPQHRAGTFAEQPQQLKAAEAANGACVGGRGGGRHGVDGWRLVD
jgi:hypothetical protein